VNLTLTKPTLILLLAVILPLKVYIFA